MQVDGVAVIAREPATADEASNDAVLANAKNAFRTVERILLEDERTLYQCMHPNDLNCVYTKDNIKSVIAHQKMHSSATEARRLAAQLAEIEEKQAQTRRNRSDGSRKGHEARRQRVHTGDTGAPVALITSGVAPLPAQFNKAIKSVQLTANALDDAIDAHRKATLNLIKLVNENPGCDPQVIAKAQQYDALKAAFGQMK